MKTFFLAISFALFDYVEMVYLLGNTVCRYCPHQKLQINYENARKLVQQVPAFSERAISCRAMFYGTYWIAITVAYNL